MFHVIEFDSPSRDTNNHIYVELAVTHFLRVPSDPYSWECADDCRGYVEIEWEYYTYYIEDQDGGEVCCGAGEPPETIGIREDTIEEYLIRMMEDDKERV